MAPPPFPVPQGMDWDPIKKRFFKALPEKARVESESTSIPSKEQNEKEFDRLHPIAPSPFANSQSDPLSLSTLRSSLISASEVQRFKREVIESTLGRAKNVSTTTIIPWSQRSAWLAFEAVQNNTWKIRINALYSCSHLGSLLYFTNGSSDVFLLDTSHITRSESSCAISHVFDYIPRPRSHHPELTFAINLDNISCVSDLRLPAQPIDGRWRCVSFDETRLANTTEDQLAIYDIGNTSQDKTPLPERSHRTKLLAQLKVKPGQIRMLCVREIEKYTILAFASQRQFGFCYDVQGPMIAKGDVAFQNVTSDVIALEVTPDGSTILVGLRNGEVKRYSSQHFLKSNLRRARLSVKAPQGCVIELPGREHAMYESQSKGVLLKIPGKGAVTNIKAVSNQEVIVAYSSGQVFLIDPENRFKVIIREFVGHVNSWSLDLVSASLRSLSICFTVHHANLLPSHYQPLCIDSSNRLFAFAGQDRKVRIWSLCHPIPLHQRQGSQSHQAHQDDSVYDLAQKSLSNKSLQDTTFSALITGLTFCQRRQSANVEGQRNESFLKRGGLPGLAVACQGNEIAFFE